MLRCLDAKALLSKTLPVLVPLVLLGCSAMPLGAGKALAQGTTTQGSARSATMSSQLMYELMIADLALRRGQLDVALEGYLRAAQRTEDARVSEQAARLSLYARQWNEAEKMAIRWSTLEPDNQQASEILVQALLRQEKLDDAVQIYEQAVESSEDKRQVLQDIQFDLQSNNNPPIAVKLMQQLVKAFPEEVEAQLGLARSSIANSDSDTALQATQAALELAPKDTDALLLRAHILAGTDKLDESLKLLETGVANDPDNTKLRLGYARLLVQHQRIDVVGEQLQRIYSESTNDKQTQLTTAMLAREAKQFEQAETYFFDLLNAGEYVDQANFNLGRIQDEREDYSAAIGFYDAVGEGELFFNSRLRAAELAALTGELEQGRKRLSDLAAVTETPERQPLLVSAESRMLQNDNQPAEALKVLTRGLNQFPENASLLYSRALAAVAAGEPQTMVDDLEKLISDDPENAHAMNALGYHFADENIELERAEQLITKALAMLPEDPAIMDSLGWLRFRQGRFDEAVEQLEKAYALFPDPEIVSHLAQALAQNAQPEKARELLEKALSENPGDEQLLSTLQELDK